MLFEFEKKYFAKHKLKTIVVGHQAFYKRQPIPKKKKIIIFFLAHEHQKLKIILKKLPFN